MSTRREMITSSSTADFSEEGGFDQDCFQRECLIEEIMNHHEVENTVLMENDQGIDCDDAEIRWIKVSIDCMEDRSSVEYTVTAQVELEDESESEWDDDSEEEE